jgi:hypothetical protein
MIRFLLNFVVLINILGGGQIAGVKDPSKEVCRPAREVSLSKGRRFRAATIDISTTEVKHG